MEQFDYKAFYEKVGKANGWNFSKVKCISEGPLWDLYGEAAKHCNKSDIVLDIGTGGGENCLPLAKSASLLVGIDQSQAMIEAATRNAIKNNIQNVRFLQMNAKYLEFPKHFFNVVTCRHSPFSAKEIAKVLINGGMFLTQQVSEHDKINIIEAFGREQAIEKKLQQQYMTELNEAGFRDIQLYEFDITEYYETAEDLIFLLKHTPILPNFGQTERDFLILEQFILNNQTEKGIKTNSARFVITATL